jgi:outer membrane autotransporter protein
VLPAGALLFSAPVPQALAQCAATGTNQTCTNPAGTTMPDGIFDTASVTVTNFGTILGSIYGVLGGTGNATVTNSGTVSGGVYGVAGNLNAIVTNSGTVSGGIYGVLANNGSATVVNSGNIFGGTYGVAGNLNATVTNSGTISGGTSAIYANSGIATVTNSGTIAGLSNGVTAFNGANITNSGSISGGNFGIYVFPGTAGVMIANSGIISGGTLAGIDSFAGATLVNSGTISGTTGIVAGGAGGGWTFTNSGAVVGTGGIAIDFSSSGADTLAFLPGSRIVGDILLGFGDTVNIHTGRDVGWLLNFNACGCGYGLIDPGTVVNVTGGAPYVISGNQIATLDPTAFGLADRTLTDFTGAISSLLASRFGEFASSGAGGAGPLAFAPASGVADGTNAAFGKIAALAYADGGNMADAAATDRASGITVWSKAFAGARHQDADGPSLAATNTVYGGVLGLDKYVAADLRLGAFLGAGTGRLDVDANSQTVKTDYAFGGVYGRVDRSSHFLDFAVSTGHAANDSSRAVADNFAPAGLETAAASYGAWFVSPELAYGLRMPLDNKVTLTPTARLRYVAGFFDGYSETGSAQNLSVLARTVQDLEERFELALSQVDRLRGDAWVKTRVTLGVLGLERLGSTTIDTILIGQNLSFAAPGQDTAAGVYGGVGFDYAVTGRITAFTAVDGTVMTDKSVAGTVKGGLRAAL